MHEINIALQFSYQKPELLNLSCTNLGKDESIDHTPFYFRNILFKTCGQIMRINLIWNLRSNLRTHFMFRVY